MGAVVACAARGSVDAEVLLELEVDGVVPEAAT